MLGVKVIFLVLVKCVLISCTQRPIIGIPTQELFYKNAIKYKPATTYIAASYVKAVESSGARVVPIFVNQNASYYDSIMESINGVVIPGGAATLLPGHPYYDTVTIILKKAIQMNKNGTYFPILGVCLGFEALLKITNANKDIQLRCNVIHENHSLQFQPHFRESLLFSQIADDTLIYLKYLPTTVNFHRWCTTIHNFTKTDLPSQWNVVATSTSVRGVKFISVIEHKEYPIIGVQFHPEKPMFEWGELQNLPHSRAAIQANRHFYDVLVMLSKFNQNKFHNEDVETDALIYNYNPIFNRNKNSTFEQIYAF